MTRVEARGAVLRLLIGLPILIGLAWSYSTWISQALLPLFRIVLGWAVEHLGALRLELAFQEPMHVFRAEVVVGKLVLLKGQMVPPGSVLRAALSAYVLLVPVIVTIAVALAWTGLSWRGRVLRVLISLPFIVAVALVDTPVLLAIALHESVRGVGAASALSPLALWIPFMDGGGRYALAIGAALLAAQLHGSITRRWHARRRTKTSTGLQAALEAP